jgi:hypothetical protein
VPARYRRVSGGQWRGIVGYQRGANAVQMRYRRGVLTRLPRGYGVLEVVLGIGWRYSRGIRGYQGVL